MKIRINASLLLKILLGSILGLLAIHVIMQLIIYFNLFPVIEVLPERLHVDRESSIPTWFSQIQLFLAAALCGLIAIVEKQKQNFDWKYWTFLSIVLLYVSIDEGAELHEIAADPMRELFHIEMTSWLVNAWILFVAPLVLIFVVIMARFLWRLPRRVSARFIAGGIVFVAGAIGAEILASGTTGLSYQLIATAEEGLEMLGVWIFLTGVFLYIKLSPPTPRLQIDS